MSEEESKVKMAGKRASCFERQTRLLSGTSVVCASHSHSTEPDPHSITGMRLRGTPVPSPGGLRNGAWSAAGPSNGADFSDEWSAKGVVKTCEYVGSFSVAHLQPSNRAEFVRLQLQSLQHPKKSRPVALFISLSGIKVFDPDNQQVTLMAHALKRISYATCDPEFCQFAFLSRNPKGPVGIQYCHVFITRQPCESEQINAIVGKAFKVAYASLRSKKEFFELMEELNREQEEYFAQVTRQQNGAVHNLDDNWTGDRVFSVGQGRIWAKQQAGRIQHKQPHIIAAVDPALQVTSPPPNHCKPLVLSTSPPPLSSNHQVKMQSASVNASSQDAHPQSQSTNQEGRCNRAVSSESTEEFEWVTEEDVNDSATALQPSEVSVKQTQRTIALPPAPYYQVELPNEWTARSIALPTTTFAIVHEQKTNQHLVQGGTNMPLTAGSHHPTPGQILLQDSTVPPPFTYKPREDGDCYGYGNGCLEVDNRLSEYSDRDSFDYDRSYAILEQFINATCDISVDLIDPDLRPSPLTKEARERPFSDVQYDENSDDAYCRRQQLEAIRFCNNNIRKPPTEINANIPSKDCTNRGQQAQRSSSQRSTSGEKSNRLSAHHDDCLLHLNGQAMNINQNANEEPNHDKPKPVQKKIKGPAPPIPVEAHKQINQSDVKNNLKRMSSMATGQNEAVDRQLQPPKSLDIVGVGVDRSARKCQPTSVEGQDCSKRLEGRSPGHIGHKVEVEIGKFRCKKVENNGIAPPLPPRSTSLLENGKAQDGGGYHGNPVQYKDIADAPWFKAGVPREIAVEILQQEEKGAFIVRESKSHPGCFALSIKVDQGFNESGIANYLVVRTKNGGCTIKGFGRDFADLPRLVHHYSIHQEQLPCKLVLSRCNPLFRQDEDDEEATGDLDYTSMTDYKAVMAGMK